MHHLKQKDAVWEMGLLYNDHITAKNLVKQGNKRVHFIAEKLDKNEHTNIKTFATLNSWISML